MKAFTRLQARALPYDASNVDTDQIVPARFLSRARHEGLAGQLFHDLRFDSAGQPRPDFVLNDPRYSGARILVADENFGCGSSREMAVWALMDGGFDAVVAASFGEIFHNNSLKNGLLPVVLPRAVVGGIRRALIEGRYADLDIDLPAQLLRTPDGGEHAFAIDALRKQLLLRGTEEIEFTLEHGAQMRAFEEAYDREFPWLSGRAG